MQLNTMSFIYSINYMPQGIELNNLCTQTDSAERLRPIFCHY